MRRFAIVLSVLMALGSSAQTKMSQVLKMMPTEMVPYLSENNRLDMIDFVESNMKAEVSNLLDGKTTLMALNDSYASLKLNDAVSMQLVLLDVSEPVDSASQIICVIRNYSAGLKDSQVEFYSVNWKRLDAAHYVSLPSEGYVADLIDEVPAKLTLTISRAFDRPATEEQQEVEKMLTTLKWDGNSFKKS